MANYEAMAAADIEEAKAVIKGKIRALKDEMREAENVRRTKHMRELAEQALKNAGVTGVTISPEPGTMGATGAQMGDTK